VWILPVVFYGNKKWSPMLREECRLKVFKNRILRKIFGHTRQEVKGSCRKLGKKILLG
jgi:hypothetical protein